MSDLARRPIRRPNKGDSPPASPRLRNRQKIHTPTDSEDELDSSMNSDVLTDPENENNSARKRKSPKIKSSLYPDLGRLADDAEVEDERENKRNRRGKKREDNNGAKRGRNGPQETTSKKTKKYPKEDKNSSSNLLMFGGFILILVIAVGVLYFPGIGGDDKENNSKSGAKIDHFKLFNTEYEHLKSQFPGQSERFWKIIRAQIRRVLTQESPTYPAIVLLGVPSQQSHMGACITKKLVQRLNSVQSLSGDFFIDSTELDDSTPSKTKLHLDQKMHKALNSSKTVVLDHIENLPGEAALLLHAFCDGDNAPYKKAVIFLVLHSSVKFPEVETEHDEVVENILANLWKSSLGEDEMPALQSRIANNIAIMKPEKVNVCK